MLVLRPSCYLQFSCVLYLAHGSAVPARVPVTCPLAPGWLLFKAVGVVQRGARHHVAGRSTVSRPGRTPSPQEPSFYSYSTIRTCKRPFLLCSVGQQRTRTWVVCVWGPLLRHHTGTGESEIGRDGASAKFVPEAARSGFSPQQIWMPFIATDVVHACWTAFTVYTSQCGMLLCWSTQAPGPASPRDQ